MGSVCCKKCMVHNTCCRLWCGCCNVLSDNFDIENLEEEPLTYDDFVKDVDTWETGDIYFLHNPPSMHSQMATNSRWTHVAVIYRMGESQELAQKPTHEEKGDKGPVLILEAMMGGPHGKDVQQVGLNDAIKHGMNSGRLKSYARLTETKHTFWSHLFLRDSWLDPPRMFFAAPSLPPSPHTSSIVYTNEQEQPTSRW